MNHNVDYATRKTIEKAAEMIKVGIIVGASLFAGSVLVLAGAMFCVAFVK